MKKSITKLTLLVLALVGCLEVNAQTSFHTSGISYEVIDGTDNVRVVYSSSYETNSTYYALTIPETVTDPNTSKSYNVVEIADGAFVNAYAVTRLSIPKSITKIGVKCFYGSRFNVFSLHEDNPNYTYDSQTRTIKSKDGSKVISFIQPPYSSNPISSYSLGTEVTSIEPWAFAGVDYLTAVISGSATNIGDYAFYGCKNLTTCPKLNVTNIGKSAFENCSSLTFSTNDLQKVKKIGDRAFFGCSGITSFNIPTSLNSLGLMAFANCANLSKITCTSNYNYTVESNIIYDRNKTKIIAAPCMFYSYTIPSTIKTIGKGAFAYNNSLFKITDENSLTSIEEDAFIGCPALEEAYLGNELLTIGDNAFNGCSKLKTVELGYRLESIGEDAFKDCNISDHLTSFKMTPPSAPKAFNNTKTGKFFVPGATYSKYNTDGWKTLQNKNMIYERSYTRAVHTNNVSHYTLWLEYPATVPEGATAYYAYYHEKDDDEEGTITFRRIADGIIPAYSGVVVVYSGTKDLVFKEYRKSSDLEPLGQSLMVGDSYSKKYAESGYNFYKYTKGSEGLGWYLANDSGTIPASKPHYAYLRLSEKNSVILQVPIRFEDGPTAIDNVILDKNSENKTIYNLSGQKVDSNFKGIIIQNGKKIFNK